MDTASAGIANALFGKGRQRVLGLLFGAPGRLHLRQIARLAGTGLGSVQREVARLTTAGLLTREIEGNQTYYRANADSPVAAELRSLMEKTVNAAPAASRARAPEAMRARTATVQRAGDAVVTARSRLGRAKGGALMRAVKQKRKAILDAAARRGARNVRLFGSVVRGTARFDSDVDILVDLEPGTSLLDLGGLKSELEVILGRKVDVATPAGLRPRVRESVLREARPL
jgi:predicted nucleotidyltransferase